MSRANNSGSGCPFAIKLSQINSPMVKNGLPGNGCPARCSLDFSVEPFSAVTNVLVRVFRESLSMNS